MGKKPPKKPYVDPGKQGDIPIIRGDKNIPMPDVDKMKKDAFKRRYPHTSV